MAAPPCPPFPSPPFPSTTLQNTDLPPRPTERPSDTRSRARPPLPPPGCIYTLPFTPSTHTRRPVVPRARGTHSVRDARWRGPSCTERNRAQAMRTRYHIPASTIVSSESALHGTIR
ncbi:hypothetical protein BKA93DRAFT_34157 [Sparassis latifolia]